MNGMLDVVHAAEHNRQLMHAAEIDRMQRAREPGRPHRRFAFARITAWWSLRMRTARAAGRAVEAAGADALDALAARSAPAASSVDEPWRPATRRFAPGTGVAVAISEDAAVERVASSLTADPGLE
jgi:hypothetical protein